MTEVHPTAVVSPRAEIASGVKIGPYSTIGDHVTIGRDTEVGAHVVIEGHTQIGERNRISPFTSIGGAPQDVGYKGEDTRVRIGDDNVIRDYVTINRSTTKENWETVIGSHNYLMAYTHVAHDCVLGDGIIMSNLATLGGHVKVGDQANLAGMVGVHQFVRIGAYAFLGGMSAIIKDVPPFVRTGGAENVKLYGINQKGLTRAGFSQETIDGLKKAYRVIWRGNRILTEGIKQVRQEIPSFPELEMLLDFFEGSKMGIMR